MLLSLTNAEGGAETIADLIELDLLCTDATGRSAGELGQAVSAAKGPALADMALNVMARRQAILGSSYPFRVSGVGVSRHADQPPTSYDAMLLMACTAAPFRTLTSGLQEAARVFEDLVAVALPAMLGPGSLGLRFGWPSQDGRPREFPDAVAWLAERMKLPLGVGYRPPRRQDGGVDVVAWRPFPDEQPGFPICLAQCTLERDFVHKSADIDLRVWSGWLRFDIDPTTALAIPYTVPKAEDWKEMASRSIVLDRIRLAFLSAGAPVPPSVAPWTQRTASELVTALA